MSGDGIRIPPSVLALVGSVIVVALAWASNAVLEMREHVASLEVRMSRAEQDASMLHELPAAVARLDAKLDILTDEVSKLRDRARSQR